MELAILAVTIVATLFAVPPCLESLGVNVKIFGPREGIQPQAHPTKKQWGILLAISLLALIVAVSDGIRLYLIQNKNPEVVHFKDTGIEHLKYVHGKHFVNEEVRVDGIHFDQCTFENVTLTYDGTDVVATSNNRFSHVRVKTNSDPVSVTVSMLKVFGFIKPGVPVLDKDEKPISSIPGTEQIH